jgi:hypothetical protein
MMFAVEQRKAFANTPMIEAFLYIANKVIRDVKTDLKEKPMPISTP